MKIFCKNIWIFVFLVCIGCALSTTSWAKVCFVGDEDCGAGADFGEYEDPMADGKSCEAEGYVLKSECLKDPSKRVAGHCPYNSNYVSCCGNEYVYDSCVYPHVAVGKCGNKYKCQCDPDKYPYTEAKCHADFKFSNPGGTACTQIDAGPTSSIKTLYYSACLCERGLFPYSEQDCAKSANADVNGDPCVDSNQNKYWASCKCDPKVYPFESENCEFGGKGKPCVEGGIYKFQECCSCAAFPAEGERGGEPNDPHATQWESCDCPRKGRFKITQCERGYEPTKDGSACVRISCEKAVKLFFSNPANKNEFSKYAIFTGTKMINYAPPTPEELEKLPVEERANAVGAEIVNTRAKVGVLLGDVNLTATKCSENSVGGTSTYEVCRVARCVRCGSNWDQPSSPSWRCQRVENMCDMMDLNPGYPGYPSRSVCLDWTYTIETETVQNPPPSGGNRGFGCTQAMSLISGAYLGLQGNSADYQMVQAACATYEPEDVSVPVLTFSGSNFPNSSPSSDTVTLKGIEVKFASDSTIDRYTKFVNTDLSNNGYRTLTFNKSVDFKAESKEPNGFSPEIKFGSIVSKKMFNSDGYNITASSMYFEAPESNSGRIGSITLRADQVLRTTIYLYPYKDTFVFHDKDHGNTFPSAQKWNAYISVNGPGTGRAKVYSSAYIGYHSYSNLRARGMQIKLQGGVDWYKYDEQNSSKTLGLTAASKLISTDWGNGNYARIVHGNNVYKRECKMRDVIEYVVNRKSGWSCATKRWDADGSYYAACTLSGASSLYTSSSTGNMSCRKTRKCPCKITRLKSGCVIGYDYHDTGPDYSREGPLLTCN